MQQLSLALEPVSPLAPVYAGLKTAFGAFRGGPRLPPLDQLVKSLISGRTYDDVSWPAFLRLKARYPGWEGLAAAAPAEIEAVIATVTHAPIKAGWLSEALGRIVGQRGELSLDFLTGRPVEEAMAWLQALPGVGGKVAASTLNFSTLRLRVMVVDTHVWRVARRIGLAPRNAEPEAVRRAITEAAPASWTDEDFYDLHWLLKRLGQTLCQDGRTRCGACPVARLCATRRQATAAGARQGNVVPIGRLGNKP